MHTSIDVIETITELFEQIYRDILMSSAYNDDNRELYYNLMKKKRAVLCASACNPMNTEKLLYELTPKQYYIEQK